jgi:hypothetical protein
VRVRGGEQAAGKGAADQADVLLPERSPARGIKWMEMTTPELVTLTTDYAPSDRALYNDCHWTTYSFEIMSPMRFESVLALLSELMCQRLSHNFQVYVGEVGASRGAGTDPGAQSDKTAVLVCGPVVHALSVSAQRIDVTNWEPRLVEADRPAGGAGLTRLLLGVQGGRNGEDPLRVSALELHPAAVRNGRVAAGLGGRGGGVEPPGHGRV